MSRLIVVSNRVAIPGKSEVGGLAIALGDALKRHGGLWCGWSGKISEKPEEHRQTVENIDYLTMDFTKAEHEDFYVGFCNSLLWPLFHYRMELTRFNQEMFEGYSKINQMFADKIAGYTKAGDTIWVHDYQLILLGKYLREKEVKEKTGFFLHIPFPVPEVFSALPLYNKILEGLCSYDLVGFQTKTDLQAFIRCVTEMAGGRIVSRYDNVVELQAYGRTIRVGNFPISIDPQELADAAEASEREIQTFKLAESLLGRSMIIGVDRLDYTKGLDVRFEGYNSFLQHSPEFKGKVTYLQITPTSRTDVEDYREMRQQIELLASHINGAHAELNWVPIRYMNKSFTRSELAGFYRLARVGLVTPLRDGMNLVAKEYVACQNPEDPGALVLSKFAGAAQELDAALLVNPYDIEEMGRAIKQALNMSIEERAERYDSMIRVLKANTISFWTKNFLSELRGENNRTDFRSPIYPKVYRGSIEQHLNA